MVDRFIVMAIITLGSGRMIRKMGGERRFMLRQVKLRRELGKMVNLSSEKDF